MVERALRFASRQRFQWQKQTLRVYRTYARAYIDTSASASPHLSSPKREIASWSKSPRSNLRLALWVPWRTSSVFPHYLPVRVGQDYSTSPFQELTDDLCNVCRKLDLATIFAHGINQDRSLAAEEVEHGTYVLAAPSPEVERIWQEERQTEQSSSLSAEDLDMMNDIQRPAIDIGYLDTILGRAADCVLCDLISVAAVESYPQLFEVDDDKGVILDTDLDVRFRCYLLTFPADETEEFRSQDTGPSATYIEIQLRTADGNKLPRNHYLLQDARDATPGHTEHLPTSAGEGTRTCLYNARPLSGAQVDFGLLQSWMHFCEDHHTYQGCTYKPCDVSHSSMTFRVIDVHNRTVIDAPSDCRYIALSYVWGASHAESLSSDRDITTPVFSTPMKLPETLPRTIKDAIHLVKQLGKSFLWVDMYCIDQSSPTDKGSQVEFMDQIYGNAFATIVAAYGDSADAGLPGVQLDSRHPERQHWEDVNGTRVFVSLPSLRTELFGNPWKNRGWTYQEGLLSRRCLIFTESQVYWKCSAELLAESIAEPEDSQRIWLKAALWHNTFSDPLLLHSITGDKDVPSKTSVTKHAVPFLNYVPLVEQYTSRDLTFQSDALPAISGILNALSRNFGSKTVWALPDSIFDLALLWKAETRLRDSNGRRPNVPSWSWVSWSGKVTYDREIQAGYVSLGTHALPVNEYWYQSLDSQKLKIIQKVDGDVVEEGEQSDGNEQGSVSDDNIHEQQNWSTGPLAPFLYFTADSARFTIQPTAKELSQLCINPNISSTTAADEAFEPDVGETIWIDDPWDGQPNPYDDQSEEKRPPMERFVGKEWEFIKMSVWDETEVFQYGIAEYEKYKELVYNVLMIEWKGDTAYRVGMGHVKASIWEKADAVRKSIKLG